MRLTLEMACSNLKLPLLLALIGAAAAASCSRRSEEAPSETAASQAPAMPAAPGSPAAEPAPESQARPEPGAAPPTSLERAEEPPRGGLGQHEDRLTTLGEAEKAFADSEQQLAKLLGPLDADKAKGGQAAAPLAGGDARCPQACKAFDSLRRAGDAICRIAGDADARCSRARDVVKQNQTRVTACGCSSNGSER
jgi:hypothetical protein